MQSGNFFDVNRPEDVAISGFLDKQSPSLFAVSWQKRYVVLTCSDKVIRYFKNQNDKDEAGSILLSEMIATGPENVDPKCKVFAVQVKDRVYAFEAESPEIMKQWISNITAVKSGRKIGSTTAPGATPDGRARTTTMSAADFIKFGYLNKGSHNALILSWQRRYVEIDRKEMNLRYYRDEPPLTRQGPDTSAGHFPCTDLAWVRPKGDNGKTILNKEKAGKIFELQTSDGKLFVFEAADTDEMFDWILALESCLPVDRRLITARLQLATVSSSSASDESRPSGVQARAESVSGGGAAAAAGGANHLEEEEDEEGEEAGAGNIRDTAFGGHGAIAAALHGREVNQKSLQAVAKPEVIKPVEKIVPYAPEPETFFKSGYLGKQSASSFTTMISKFQKRFIAISKHDHILRYYKDDRAAKTDVCPDVKKANGTSSSKYVNDNKRCLGFCDIYEAEFVRAYDATSACTVFEIGLPDRTFIFDAGTVVGRKEWIATVESVMQAQSNLITSMKAEQLEKSTPEVIRLFDRLGVKAFQEYVQQTLAELYPPQDTDTAAGDNKSAVAVAAPKSRGEKSGGPAEPDTELATNLAGVKKVIVWLSKTLPDIRKSAARAARYDIMAVTIDAVNRYLDSRIMPIIGSSPPSDVLQLGETADIYQAIILMTEHQQLLNKIYCPVHFKTRSGLAGTRASTNIRFTTTNFGNDSLADRDSMEAGGSQRLSPDRPSELSPGKRFDSESYRPGIGSIAIEQPPDEEEEVEVEDKGIPIIPSNSTGSAIVINAAGIPVYRFHCGIFEKIPEMCTRYVEGSFVLGSQNKQVLREGTGAKLVDHCNQVWEKMLVTPTDFVHRHQDGTFYTETPTLIWQTLHQHVQLAINAHSALLHIMVAEKISLALNQIVRTIAQYVSTMDTKNDNEMRDMELEFVCALINDNALHIEEVITLVESFESDAVREKVNESFDPVTEQLIRCGQVCLTRLVEIIITDMSEQFLQIYTEELWLEGDTNQVSVIVATVQDYMTDFEEFLMPFWFKKFVSIVLETVVLKYIYSILKHSGTDEAENAVGDLATFGRISKDINELCAFLRKSLPEAVEDIGKRKVERQSTLEMWEVKAEGSDDEGEESTPQVRPGKIEDLEDIGETNEYLVLIQVVNELNYYLTSNYDKAASHAMNRIAAFPSSAEAIQFFFLMCMGMREDLDEDELEECEMFIKPAMNASPGAAAYNAEHAIAEGRLGSLYDSLYAMTEDTITRESGFGMSDALGMDGTIRGSLAMRFKKPQQQGGNSVTHRMKMFTNIPLQGLKDSLKAAVKKMAEIAEDEDDSAQRQSAAGSQAEDRSSINRLEAASKSKGLVMRRSSLKAIEEINKKRVEELTVLLEDEEADKNELLGLEEGQDDERTKMEQRIYELQFSLESYLEKRSPTSKLWQRRFIRIMTRVNENAYSMSVDAPGLVEYVLLWYKAKGETVLKSFNLSRVVQVRLLDCPRPLCYCTDKHEVMLADEAVRYGYSNSLLKSEAGEKRPASFLRLGSVTVAENYTFAIVAGKDPTGRDPENHELVLRAPTVDKMVPWLNALLHCSSLRFNEKSGLFSA